MSSIIFLLSFLFVSTAMGRDIDFLCYNVQNLFDDRHDSGKADGEFLPKGASAKKRSCSSGELSKRHGCFNRDWNEEKIRIKIENIAKVVEYFRIIRPDFLGVMEIENERVAKMLAKRLGYTNFLISNSKDPRGVDVAIFYNESRKIKLVQQRSHELLGEVFKKHPTRPILEGEFTIEEKSIHFFVNHWPSQGGPTAARVIAAQRLREQMERSHLQKNHYAVACGDFNTLERERPNPIDDILLSNASIIEVKPKMSEESPLGTYFYPKELRFHFFDKVFVSKKISNSQKASLKIIAPPFATTIFKIDRGFARGSIITGVPKRFTMGRVPSGYSDHFPVFYQLKW